MPAPDEYKIVHSRILAYAQEIGWTYVPCAEAEERRGFDLDGATSEDCAMPYQLMTAQIRVHDLDLDEFLALVAREILSQPVREFGNSLSPKRQEAGQRPESSSDLASGQ
jgi:hypothetical protein